MIVFAVITERTTYRREVIMMRSTEQDFGTTTDPK